MYYSPPAHLVFDNTDTVEMAEVTGQSITVRWKKGQVLDEIAAPYVGYYIYYRRDTDWARCCEIAYDPTVVWQQGTIMNLEANTMYEIDISVYRVNQTGHVFEETEKTSRKTLTLNITTDKCKFSIILPCKFYYTSI